MMVRSSIHSEQLCWPKNWRIFLKLFAIGLIVLVLGILSFFVPISHTEQHRLDAGDIHIGVNTHHSDLLPPYVGIALVVIGGGLMVVGGRKRA